MVNGLIAVAFYIFFRQVVSYKIYKYVINPKYTDESDESENGCIEDSFGNACECKDKVVEWN